MNGREKLKTKEIIAKYPEGIHITAVDLVPSQKEDKQPYAVVQFKESEHEYYCGGLILTKIVLGLLEECDNDFDTLNAELNADPIGIKLTCTTTKDDNNLTMIEILD